MFSIKRDSVEIKPVSSLVVSLGMDPEWLDR